MSPVTIPALIDDRLHKSVSIRCVLMLIRTGTDRACALIITNDVSDIKRKYIVYVVQHKMLLLNVNFLFTIQCKARNNALILRKIPFSQCDAMVGNAIQGTTMTMIALSTTCKEIFPEQNNVWCHCLM